MSGDENEEYSGPPLRWSADGYPDDVVSLDQKAAYDLEQEKAAESAAETVQYTEPEVNPDMQAKADLQAALSLSSYSRSLSEQQIQFAKANVLAWEPSTGWSSPSAWRHGLATIRTNLDI
jgi:hypothetical protein